MASGSWFARTLRSRSGLLQWILLIASVGFVAWILVSRGDDLKAAFRLTPGIFILITLSSFGTFALNGIELQVLSGKFGRRIPFLEGQVLGLMVSTLNYLPMKTGTVLNGVVLRSRYKLPLSDFTALIGGSTVVHLWMCGSMAGIALLLGDRTHVGWGLLFLLLPTAGVLLLILWGRLRTPGRFEGHGSRIVRTLWRVVDGVGEMFSDHVLLAKDVAINIGLVALWSARSYWSFQAIGIHANFGSVLTMSALGILFTRLSVIPGGVGFREAGAAFGAAIAGLSAEAGFAASVIDRAVMLVWLLVIGVPATAWFLRMTGVSLGDALKSPRDAEGEGADGAV